MFKTAAHGLSRFFADDEGASLGQSITEVGGGGGFSVHANFNF